MYEFRFFIRQFFGLIKLRSVLEALIEYDFPGHEAAAPNLRDLNKLLNIDILGYHRTKIHIKSQSAKDKDIYFRDLLQEDIGNLFNAIESESRFQ